MLAHIQVTIILALCTIALAAPAPEPSSGQSDRGRGHRHAQALNSGIDLEAHADYRKSVDSSTYILLVSMRLDT